MKHLWLRRFVPVLIVVACCGAYRVMSAVTPVATTVPVVRATPHAILPRYDVPAVASDAQLAAVLERVQPPVGPPNTNDLLHALRLWGPGAKFADPAIPSGATMRDYLLDDAVFRRLADDAPPLIDTTQEYQRPRSYRARRPRATDGQCAHGRRVGDVWRDWPAE
ncbi:MAG: hypothetical protein R3C10_05445 [Pirellulales bacterium]